MKRPSKPWISLPGIFCYFRSCMRGLHITILGILLLTFSCRDEHANDARIFHYNLPNNVTSLDPAFAKDRNNIWVVDHLYSTLVQFDDNMEIVPDLAKSWNISPDGMTYTFHLRNDVQYHSSEVLNADRRVTSSDVAYSLGRLIDEDVRSPGSWVLTGAIDYNQPFRTPDDSTFILNLERPFPPMLGILTMQYCSVVPQEVVEHYGDEFRKNPIGTGPFKLLTWQENEGLFFERNDNYHLDIDTNLDGIRISFISDRKTALMEMLTGELHFQSGIDPSYKAILLNENGQLQEKHRDKVDIITSPYLNMEYLGVNLDLARDQGHPLADKYLRKAMNFALDKERMMTSLRSGFGAPAVNGFIPKGMPGFDPGQKGYHHNVDSARYYLEMGYYDGAPIVLHTNKDYLDLCLYAMKEWQALGINTEVELLESSLLRERMRKGEIVFFRASWIGDYPDEETFLTVFYGQNPAPPNYTRFSDARYDSLYEDAMKVTAEEDRREIYRRLNQRLIDEAPVIFLYYDETMLLTAPELSGVSRNGFNLLRLDSLSLKVAQGVQ